MAFVLLPPTDQLLPLLHGLWDNKGQAVIFPSEWEAPAVLHRPLFFWVMFIWLPCRKVFPPPTLLVSFSVVILSNLYGSGNHNISTGLDDRWTSGKRLCSWLWCKVCLFSASLGWRGRGGGRGVISRSPSADVTYCFFTAVRREVVRVFRLPYMKTERAEASSLSFLEKSVLYTLRKISGALAPFCSVLSRNRSGIRAEIEPSFCFLLLGRMHEREKLLSSRGWVLFGRLCCLSWQCH